MRLSPHWRLACWLPLVAACHTDAPASPEMPVPTTLSVVSGDGQQADPQDMLDTPVRFRVVDADRKPMFGVQIQLSIPVGGGSVPSATIVTDSSGVAETTWTMGPYSGVQQLVASATASLTATVTATTCSPDDCFPASNVSSALSDATLLTLATYDSSGQAMHPDIVQGHGHATGFWLAVTPYTNGNSFFENPSIFRSRDANTWKVPAGATNPLSRPVSPDYLSDPDLVIDADQHLWMYFRAVSANQNIIKLIRSDDGVHWDSATTVITVPSHGLVSPAVVLGAPQSPWQMWSINAGLPGCNARVTTVERRQSTDGVNWGPPLTVNLQQPGETIWHIDVQWIPARNEYWALYNAYTSGTSCNTDALYLARSPDGVTWTTYPSPIARAGVVDAFKHVIYRSTFMTNPRATQVRLWMSGAKYNGATYNWQTASVTTSVAGLFAIASAPATAVRTTPFPGKLPPPEPDVGPDRP